MKRNHFLLAGLVIALVASVFWVAGAYAATDCFSDIAALPTVFQEAICWMKDNGVTSGYPDGTYNPNGYVTRAQMAIFMKNQAEVPPSSGELAFTFGPSEWTHGILESDVSVIPGPTLLISRTDAIGSNTLVFSTPALPSAIYNRETIVAGAEICYGGDANHYLDSLTLAVGGVTVTDNTNRTEGNGCVSLMFPSPPTLYPRNYLSITANVRLSAAGSFAIKTATVYLNHSNTLTGP